MEFILGLVGNPEANIIIEKEIRNHFADIHITALNVESEQQLSKHIGRIKKMQSQCDGILYINQYLHDVFNHYVLHKIPNTIIQIDTQEILRSLLSAGMKYNYNLQNLSIDTITYNDVLSGFELIESEESTNLNIITVQTNFKQVGVIENIIESHIHNQLHNNALIITDIIEVEYQLLKKGHKVILLKRSTDSLLKAVKSLMTKTQVAVQRKNKLAVITISLSMPSENFILESTQHALILAYNRIAEAVYWFSEKVNGCFIAISRKQYNIFCDSKILEAHTEDFTKLQLLDVITEKQMLSIFIGIGFGVNHREAMKLSTIAHSRATARIESRAYVMYNSKKIVGPILPSSQSNKYDHALYEIRLAKVSKEASISIDTIYKLQAMIINNKRHEYTSQSVSEQLNMSLRTVNRLVEKLENTGYVEVIGRKSSGGKGRPCRIYRFTF